MSSRRPLIAGNWKMNGSAAMARDLAGGLSARIKTAGDFGGDMLLCPPAVLIPEVVASTHGSGIAVGGQDCHFADKGAHTGDIAATMLKDAGCSHVILGHSERRADHGETSEIVRSKATAALSAGLVAVICVGETELERDSGNAADVVRDQLVVSLPEGATPETVVIAYEPVWAIGTGKTASPDDAQDMHAMIRAELAGVMGEAAEARTRILYGGSMKPGNAGELLAKPDIDGGLIGGASLKVDDFWGIAESCP